MKIVQLANFYSDTSGGLRTALRSLAHEYLVRGHEVVRVVPGAASREWDDDGTRVVEIAAPALGSTGYRIIRDTHSVRSMLQALRPDAIELSDKSTLVGAASHMRPHGTRVILFSHERLDAILRPKLPGFVPLERPSNVWNRRLARRVDAIVCASDFAAQEFHRIGAPHVQKVPLGVDLDTYCPGEAPADTARSPLRLAMVGRLSSEKSPQVAIDTVRSLAARGIDVHLAIAGAGPMLDMLRQQATELPIRFLGHVSNRREVVELLRTADAVLAPCGVETFGLAAVEAMACGTPVVGSDQGALTELIAPGTGIAVPATGPTFAEAVLQVTATDRSTTRTLCRDQASRYSWSNTATEMLRLMAPVSKPAPMIGAVDEHPTLVPSQAR